MLHGPDGEVERVVDCQAVRLGRRREGRQSRARVGRGCHVQVWLVLKFGIPHGPGLAKELKFLSPEFSLRLQYVVVFSCSKRLRFGGWWCTNSEKPTDPRFLFLHKEATR